MAIIAKIAARPGKPAKIVSLRKMVTVLAADPDADIAIVDQATGLVIDGAQVLRGSDGLTVILPATAFAVATDQAAGQGAAVSGTPTPDHAGPNPAAEIGGGGNGLALGVLGGLAALGGLAVAAGGGGKGNGASGNVPTPAADTTPPAAPSGLALASADDTGPSSTDGITSQTSALTISGTAEAGSTVILRNGTTTLATVTATSGGTFSTDVTLAAGPANITATATDSAGNVSAASAALAIIVDTTAPTAPTALVLAPADDTGASSTDGITSQTSGLTISGTAEANASVTLRDGATVLGTVIAGTNGVFSYDAALAAGQHSITATATDSANNVGAASSALAVEIDTTAPTVIVTSAATSMVKGVPVGLTFTFSETPVGFAAGDIVTAGTVSGFAVSPTDPKVYTAQLTHDAAASGTLTVSVTAGSWSDKAGNPTAAPAPLSFAYDAGSAGAAIDGYIASALVFRDTDGDSAWDHERFTDANNNGLYDQGEVFEDANGDRSFTAEYATQTDLQGNFANLFGSGRIVLAPLIAGNGQNLSYDISTGAAFTGRYSAADGSTVVTPLTTLVESLAGAGATKEQVEAAELKVKSSLGIDASVQLATFDPFAVAADSATGAQVDLAVAVQKAAVQVANVITVLASASEAVSAGSGQQAADATVSAIASLVATGAPVNLSSNAVIGQVVGAVAEGVGGTVQAAITSQSDGIGSSLASVNAAVEQASGGDTLTTFAAIVTTQVVAQQTLAQDVATAVGGGAPLDAGSYTGSALADKIDQAASAVQTVLPSDGSSVVRGAPERPVIDAEARISSTEASDGVIVSVTYAAGTGAVAGDTLNLKLGDTLVASRVLASGDIPAAGASTTLLIPVGVASLGADGTKIFTASFSTAAGIAGPVSLPAIATLDTGTVTPNGLLLVAADDSGISSADAITSKSSGLTITGNAEANSTVSLYDGATLVGTGTADPAGAFAIDVSLSEGAHVLIATTVDPAGNASTASAALSVRVDTTAPASPAGLATAEGTLVTTVEGADGASISGAVEAGSTVSVTFANGATSLVKQAMVSGTAFTAALSASELAGLGGGQISYRAVASDAAGNSSTTSPTAHFIFTRDAFVTDQRIDTALSRPVEDEEDLGVGMTALAGGGFAVHWVVDSSGDGDADSMAVQRFGADGSKVGGVVVLQGVSPALLNSEGENQTIDFRALDGGGYVLAYGLPLEESGRLLTVNGGPNGQSVLLPIVGQLHELYAGSAPASVTFALSGVAASGGPLTVALTRDADGVIAVSRSVLDQFAIDNRITVVVNGLPQGQNFPLWIDARQDVTYDVTTSLTSVSAANVATGTGTGFIFPSSGRPEAFTIDSASYANRTGPTSVAIQLVLNRDSSTIDLTGINAVRLPNGAILLANLTPDANGAYRVPAPILAQLGDDDAQAILFVNGLTAGSAISGTVQVRAPLDLPEGVFVQTFDANGIGGQVGERLDRGSSLADLEDNSVSVSRLSGGGFIVKWPVDSDGDGETDTLGIQRFSADGSKVGTAIVMTGVDPRLLNHEGDDPAIDLQPLGNGGYALGYTLPLQSFGKMFTLVPNETLVSFAGRATEIFVGSTPAGVTFALTGLANDGHPLSIPVAPVGGVITVTQSLLDQFQTGNRLTLRANGLTTGIISGFADLKADVAYDPSAPLQTTAFTGTVLPIGFIGISTNTGRVEQFDLDPLPGTPTVALRIITGSDMPLDLTGIANAIVTGAGVVQFPVTPDANGVVTVPQSILAQLGDSDASIMLVLGGLPADSTVTASMGVRPAVQLAEGVFVQTFSADGVGGSAGARIDPPALRADLEDEDNGVRISALPGGGFAAHWLVDGNGDGETDTVGIQRFAADGSKTGDAVMLQGVDSRLVNSESDDLSFDLQALENGGYALTYNLPLEETSRGIGISAQANNQTLTIPIVGRPHEFYVGGAPANAAFALSGVDNSGAQKFVALTVEDASIAITTPILDQFLYDNRLTLVITGLTQGQSFTVGVDARQDVYYDLADALAPVATSFTALAFGLGVIAAPVGRAEGFAIGSAVYANGTGPSSVSMQFNPVGDAAAFDISGVAGAARLPNGAISIGNLTADVNGVYRVPAALLAQLGTNDAQVVLFVNGLVGGSTLSGTALVREAIEMPEGVFVQTFDDQGLAVSLDVNLTGTAGDDVLVGDVGRDVLVGLEGADRLVAGAGIDTLTGGAGQDLFVLDSPGGQVLSAGDLVTDFTIGEDRLALSGGLSFGDVLVVQGDPGINGALANESLIIHGASGDILARLANVEAVQVTQASFL